MTALLVIIIVAVLALLGLVSAVRIVTQYEQGVLFRLGRLVASRPPGLRLIIPVADVDAVRNGTPQRQHPGDPRRPDLGLGC